MKIVTRILAGASLCVAPAIAGWQPRGQEAMAAPQIDDLQQFLSDYEDSTRFREAVAIGVENSPIIAERRANSLEADATRREAASARLPTIDLALNANRALAREFSNDPDNVIERSRGPGRADVSASANQTLYDFGAANRRIEATSARIKAAQADVEAAYENVALRAIGAWIDMAAYTWLVALAERQVTAQESYRIMLQARIDQGVSAPVDHARLNAAIAISEQRASRFRKELGNAEARYREFFDPDTMRSIRRPPMIDWKDADLEEIVIASQNSAAVKSAKARADGSRSDARAAKADTLPNVGVGIDAGRYGIFEPGRTDYDVRARVSLRYRLLGPGNARADQALARSFAAQARSDEAHREAEREARIALSDVQELATSSLAIGEEYRANRTTRDAEVARFRIARGTMFDVLTAEEQYFASAVSFLRSTSELDAARYVLLARVGGLLSELRITPQYNWQTAP